MSTHEHYEELCALAVTGQASGEELADLRSHLEGCPNCRAVAYDFSQISSQGLSTLAAKRLHSQIPLGMEQRFVARAHSEGIEISEAVRRSASKKLSQLSFRVLALGAAAAAVILGTSFFVLRHKIPKPSVVQLPPVNVPVHVSPIAVPTAKADSHINEQLLAAQKQLTSLEEMIKAQRAELDSTKDSNASLAAQLADTRLQNSALQKQIADQETRVTQLQAELQKAASEKEVNSVALTLQENEIRQLQNKLSEQSAALKQEQALTAKGGDVRDLVVARNLHIIDVHDRDGNGKSQRTFGRIFYTEGKSLIFYAYDLADPHKLNAKVSFQVWGERLGAEKPILSLGVLHKDDPAAGRWVLLFDDSQVLAQIDSVFVTAEPSQKLSTEPRGERILFAFLGGKPNHP